MPKKRSWTDEQLAAAVAASHTYKEVVDRLGLRPGGGTHIAVRVRIAELGLDDDHIGRGERASRRPLDEILVEKSDYGSTHLLKLRLIDEGVKEPRCEICSLAEWNGMPMPLHLDHVNGDRRDNRLENLRIVCPNCHAQTPTYCGRNIGAYSPDR